MYVPTLFFKVTAIVAMWCLLQEMFQFGLAVGKKNRIEKGRPKKLNGTKPHS